MSEEFSYGITGSLGVNAAAIGVSVPPLLYPSKDGHINPVRDLDILGLTNFFDHSGNCVNGALATMAVVTGGMLVDRYTNIESRRLAVITTAVGGATVSSAVNVAYEAGVYIPPFPQKSPDSHFDEPDAIYGSVTGILVAAVFCYSALRQSFRTKKQTDK